MRPLIAVLLLFAATSAAAETPYSIDFNANDFTTYQGQGGPMSLQFTGKLTGATLFTLSWTYSFDVTPPVSGTIEITEKTTAASFPIEAPITSSYVGPVPGRVTISYQVPGQQPVTKSATLTLMDYTMGVAFENDRVLESDTSPHTVFFRLRKPTTRPLTLKFSPGTGSAGPDDYTLLDTTVNISPGTTGVEVRYAVTRDGIQENEEWFVIETRVYDGATEVGYGGCTVTITDREIRAMFVPDQLNVFAGDPFSLVVMLSEPIVPSPHSSRTSMSFATSNPSVVSGLPSPLTVGASTIVGTMTASAGLPGDAIVTAQDAEAGTLIPAAAHVHVYDGRFSFGELKTLVIAPGQSIAVPFELTPPPPEPTEFFAIEDRLAGFVDVDSFVTIDTAGHGTLTIRGKKIGTTIVAIESPGRRRISGIDVVVKNAPPPPPPPPSRRRSARH